MELENDHNLAAPAATAASPQWWGADSIRARMRDVESGGVVFVKTMTPASATYIDYASSFAAATAAGDAGIGPKVLHADVTNGELVMEDLTGRFSTASNRDFNDTNLMDRFVKNRRGMWKLEADGIRHASVFDDIRNLHGKCDADGVILPPDIRWMLSVIDDAEERIKAAGVDEVLIHGDCNASNLAVDRGSGDGKLLDYDWAAYADPLQDIGSVLLELSINEHDPEEIFERYWGSFDVGLFSRAMCYRAADAVRGALTGAWVDHCDPGSHEYSKFSDWMFFWAREALGNTRIDFYLEKLS